jgi:hypothetical protein
MIGCLNFQGMFCRENVTEVPPGTAGATEEDRSTQQLMNSNPHPSLSLVIVEPENAIG